VSLDNSFLAFLPWISPPLFLNANNILTLVKQISA